jgi:hypothetical protein
MAHFPDEAALIERLWGLVCNSMDLKQGPWNSSKDSVQWREAMGWARDEYHNWLSFYIATHQADTLDPDAAPTTGDLIESLKMVCDCGNCDGAWVSRFEANHIIDKLKRLAELESTLE